MGDWVVQSVLQEFVRMVLAPLPQLLILVRDLVLRVPDVTGQQPVIRLAGRSLGVVQIGYVVVVIVAGMVTMAHGSLQSAYSAGALLQRAVLGFVAAHFALWVIGPVTVGANAVIAALAPRGDRSLGELDTSQAMSTMIEKAPETLLILLIVQTLILVLLVYLLVSWVIRFVRLALIAGLGPLALACHGLPWLEPVAAAWWRMLGALVVTVVVQAAALQFGLELLLDPGTDLSGVGNLDHSDVLTNMLLILCLLLVVLRVPSMVGGFMAPAGGRRSGFGSQVLRYVLVNRMLNRGGRGLIGSGRPGGRVMSTLAGRFARRQLDHRQARENPDPRTWGAVGRGLQARGRYWRSEVEGPVRSWPAAVAAGTAGPGKWGLVSPAVKDQIIQTGREATAQRARQRAVLAGRTVAAGGAVPARVAGRGVLEQREGAAEMLRQRQAQARHRSDGSRALAGARPIPTRTAGLATGRAQGETRQGIGRSGSRPATSTSAGRRGPALPVTRSSRAPSAVARASSVRAGQRPPPPVVGQPSPGQSRPARVRQQFRPSSQPVSRSGGPARKKPPRG